MKILDKKEIEHQIESTSARRAELEALRLSIIHKSKKTVMIVESNATAPRRKAA